MTNIGWSPVEIADKNNQYRRFAVSKNNQSKDYQIETKNEDGFWTFRMRSLTPGYLDSVGRRWVEGKLCNEYRVTEKT